MPRSFVNRSLALGVACLAGCHSRPRPVTFPVSRISVSEATLEGNPALDLTATDFKDRLVTALDRTGRFEPKTGPGGKASAASWRCHAEVSFTRESDDATGGDAGASLRRADVGLAVELSPSDSRKDPLRAEVTAQRLFDGAASPTARTKAFRGALDQALAQALTRLLLDLDASGESDAQLISALGSPDAGVRDSAVRQLADRKNPAAVPALIERLHDPDRQVVMRTMGALEALRDPRAVQPLIELTEHQDPAFVAQVVYVLGGIGGTDAEAYLFTLENGSQDAQVRAAAAEATAELHRRAHVATRAGAAPHPPRADAH
ncbi:MAG: HEAT repeat domain-containing protein [Deltaproteobacteria bacterium]